MYILRPDLDEEAVKSTIERFSTLVTEQGGQVTKAEPWGKRRLAYLIDGYKEGYYVLMNFSAQASVPAELERVYKITDTIIRYMIIREDE
jgi:small subunit ribosomal protein S6